MARVTYGSLVTELKGSTGGLTWQKNPSGDIVRLRPQKRVNPSNPQGFYNTHLAYLIAEWVNLSLINKETWNDLAAAHDHIDPWGVSRHISGYQWYLSNNNNLFILNGAQLQEAPEYLLPDPPPSFELKFSGTDIYLEFSEAVVLTDRFFALYVTPPVRTSSLKSRRSLFLLEPGTWDSSTVYNITVPYVAKFGYDVSELINDMQFIIISRCCLIDNVSGFRSAYADYIKQSVPGWISNLSQIYTPPLGTVGVDIAWGDGIEDALIFYDSFSIEHDYPDDGYHHWYLDVYFQSTHHYFDENSLGPHGTINVTLFE